MDQNPKKTRRGAPRAEETLEKEISIIREMINKVYVQTKDITDVKLLLRVLDIISSASARLVGLLREEQDILETEESSSTLTGHIERLVGDIAREKGLIS